MMLKNRKTRDDDLGVMKSIIDVRFNKVSVLSFALALVLSFSINSFVFAETDVLSRNGSYVASIPKGFENLVESQRKMSPIVVYFLGSSIDSGYLIKDAKQKRFKSSNKSKSKFPVDTFISCRKEYNEKKLSTIARLCKYANKGSKSGLKLVPRYDVSKGEYITLLASDDILENYLSENHVANSSWQYRLPKDHDDEYLVSTSEHISGRIGYRLNASHDDEANVISSISLPSLLSYKNTKLVVNPTFQKDRYNNDKLSIDQLNTSTVSNGFEYELGYKSSYTNSIMSSNLGVLSNVGVIGGWISTVDKDLKSKSNMNFGYGQPLNIYMPYRGSINVFMGDRLIYTQIVSAGKNLVPIDDFPLGNYDVRIERKSIDGSIESEPIYDTVNKSRAVDNNITVSFGLGSDRYSSSNVLGREFTSSSEPYFGLSYANRMSKNVNASFVANVLGDRSSLLSDFRYSLSNSFGLGLSGEVDPKELDWATQIRSSFVISDVFDNKLSTNVYVRNLKKNGNYSVSLLTNGLLPVNNIDWLDTVGFNSVYNLYNASSNQKKYREVNLTSSSHFSLFNLPFNLNLSAGTSTDDNLRGNISLTMAFNSNNNSLDGNVYSINGGYSYSDQNSNTIDISGSVNGDGYNYTATGQVGNETRTLGLSGNIDNDIISSSFGVYRTKKNGRGKWYGNETANISGNVYFSGDNLSFNSKTYDSGYLVDAKLNRGNNRDSELYASAKNETTVQIEGGKTNLVPVTSFSEGNVSFSGTNAFSNVDSLSYSLFPGNFEFSKIEIFRYVNITGYISGSGTEQLKRYLGDDIDYYVSNGKDMRIMYKDELYNDVYYFDSRLFLNSNDKISNQLKLVDGEMNTICNIDLNFNLSAKAIEEGFMYVGETTCD